MKKKSLKRGFSERIDFKRELIRDTTQGIPADVDRDPPPVEKKPASRASTKKSAEKTKKKQPEERLAIIKVVGIGGGGNNAVNEMINAGLAGVDLVAINTDIQSLKKSLAPEKIQIGIGLTRGLGTGGNPKIGEEAAKHDRDALMGMLENADLVFITACMGGGTGTGASPVIAELARESGALTIGIVTKPFQFEGTKRKAQAEEGIEKLRGVVDALIVIPNERLLQTARRETSFQEAFKSADYILFQAVRGITDLISSAQDINLDLADLRTVLTGAGTVLIGIGHGRGKEKAKHAAEEAIFSPLLEISIKGALSVLLNITSGPDMTLHEVTEIMECVRGSAGTETDVLWGSRTDQNLSNEVVVTVIATRFQNNEEANGEPSGEFDEVIDPGILFGDVLEIPAFLRDGKKKPAGNPPVLDEKSQGGNAFPFFRRMKGE
ncbi:MAG TPA: cell division protein FtsZ [Atribacteraceae bacterium]|nr:cell division protein FtsZ [Atribacteraceae bacterium]